MDSMKRLMFDPSSSAVVPRSARRLRSAGAASLLLAIAACSSAPAPVTSDFPTGTQPAVAGRPASVATAGTPAIPTTTTSPSAGAAGSSPTVTAPAAVGGTSGSSLGVAGTPAVSGASGSSAAGAAGASAAAGSRAAAGSSASAGATAAGSGSVAGTGAAGSGAAGGSAPAHEDAGKGDGSDVVLIGDSWMDNTLQIEGTGGGIAPSLMSASGQRYRNYGLQGVMLLMADTFGPAIPSQWDDAKRENPKVKTVVMTGGGNDVIQGSSTLQSSCQSGGDECKQKLLSIGQALDKLWTQMATDGVADIVYIRYTDATGTLDPSLQGDKGFPPPTICTSGKVRCHSVLTSDIVAKADLAADGIHPLQAANEKIAKRIFELMTTEGIRR
jgi:hypothetical protein